MWGQQSGFRGAEGFNTPDDGPAFTFEALIGMRAFRVNLDGTLVSPVYTTNQWRPGTMHAAHKQGSIYGGGTIGEHDPCPNRECSAGFYAYHGEGYWYDRNGVTGAGGTAIHPWLNGVIAGWGRVVNGPRGFRCQKATILALCLPIMQPKAAWEAIDKAEQWPSFDAWAEWVHTAIQDRFPAVPIFADFDAMVATVPLSHKEPA